MALPEKRRCGVTPRRFRMSGFCCFVLPCFAAGCHAFGLKIATAALRPRNDTKLGRLYLGNGRFSFMRPFFARCCSAPFFKRFVLKTVCPEDAAARKAEPDERIGCPEKKYAAGEAEKASRYIGFFEFFFYIVCVILFKILPSDSTRKSKFVCIFCGLTSKKKENILKSANRYIAYRTNEQEAEHHGSEYKFCGRPV